MRTTTRATPSRRYRALAVLVAAGLALSACGDDEPTAASDDTAMADDEAMADDDDAMADDDDAMADDDDAMADDDEAMADDDEAMADDDDAMADDDEAMADDDEAMAEDDAMVEALTASGPGCAAVPAEGEGSFSGMADDPAATAASNNPLLSTLVTAVQEADLVEILNSDGPYTIFAPTNDAFSAVPEADLQALLDDPEALSEVLSYHVVAGDMSVDDLVAAGSATTVSGAELSFDLDGEALTVNGGVTAICQNVLIANGTVHIIDGVLLPE